MLAGSAFSRRSRKSSDSAGVLARSENAMMAYRHRQGGTLIIVLLGIAVILTAGMMATIAVHPIAVGVVLLLLVCIAMFNSLSVEVTDETVRVQFGPGPIGKKLSTSSIKQARTVRNPWYYGWGIRWIPGGWLFNVSGFDAVELVMLDGRVYRIGTDQPGDLLAAIKRVCSHAG